MSPKFNIKIEKIRLDIVLKLSNINIFELPQKWKFSEKIGENFITKSCQQSLIL